MSDNNEIFGPISSKARLSADGLALMLKGAGYAAVFCVLAGITIWVIFGISAILPEASKEAVDPSPLSFLIESDETIRLI